jgi:hypothetical protein
VNGIVNIPAELIVPVPTLIVNENIPAVVPIDAAVPPTLNPPAMVGAADSSAEAVIEPVPDGANEPFEPINSTLTFVPAWTPENGTEAACPGT